jgi:hypothetical protein
MHEISHIYERDTTSVGGIIHVIRTNTHQVFKS